MADASPLDSAISALTGDLFEVPLNDPFAAALFRARRACGVDGDPGRIIEVWQASHPGSPVGDMRYRWPLNHRRVEVPQYAGHWRDWVAWRELERQVEVDPRDLEDRLVLPQVLTECAELLYEVADSGSEWAEPAGEILRECEPILRRDYARFIQAVRPWDDTFALWCLVRRERTFERLRPFALGIASCYQSWTEQYDGILCGWRFPFHEVPLASASAQLARGLLALGYELAAAGKLVTWVREQRHADGGWGDGESPSDLITTLVCADLLLHTDPTFDPAPTLAFFASRQEPTGAWCALGPEAPWLTWAIVEWIRSCEVSFGDRFRWSLPHEANRDEKTGLPFYAWFSQTAALFQSLQGLAQSDVELGFIDLAGFREFNNRFGQDRGDDVLRELASQLRKLAGVQIVRDGGDEFLVVGAPTRAPLAPDLETFRTGWPDRFTRVFGSDVPPVAPRILVGAAQGAELLALRQQLGREIGRLKSEALPGDGSGIQRVLKA